MGALKDLHIGIAEIIQDLFPDSDFDTCLDLAADLFSIYQARDDNHRIMEINKMVSLIQNKCKSNDPAKIAILITLFY